MKSIGSTVCQFKLKERKDSVMKPVVVIGAESFAELLFFYLKNYSKREIVAFSVHSQYIKRDQETFCGLPIIPFERLEVYYPAYNYDVILGLGHSKMNTVRKTLFFACKEKGYSIASFIHPTTFISKDAVLGEGNIILENSLIQPFVTIGDGNLLWDSVAITHNDRIGNFNTFAGNTGLSGFVTVGDHCYFGKHSMTFDKLQIADFTLIGAGAFVKRNTKPYDVIVPVRSMTLEGKRSTDFL